MNSEDLVSVIIPTYKRPDKLRVAIDSVLHQSYPCIEVIVVDDNNPETEERRITEGILTAYAGEPRVRYVQHECNKNGSAARNTGVKNALGDWIAFLDDDDEYLPYKIESQINALKGRSEEWACCYSKYATRKPGEKPFASSEHREGNLYLEALMREFHIASGSNLLIKKDAFEAIKGFDESFIRNQDIEFLTRLLQKYKIAYSDYCGLIVNVHTNHGFFDEQKIIDQYVERFQPYVSLLSDQEHAMFYRKINQQRFFDFFRVKHNYRECIKMIHRGDVSIWDATSYLMRRLWSILKRTSAN